MRTSILLLVSIVCCLVGCATKHKAPPVAPPPPPPTASEPIVEPEIIGTLPDPKKGLSHDEVAQLKQRLGLLKKGMTREQVMEVLNLASFDVRVTSHVGPYGTIYFIEHGHRLLLSINEGNDAFIFRWAQFDGEYWPKSANPPILRSTR